MESGTALLNIGWVLYIGSWVVFTLDAARGRAVPGPRLYYIFMTGRGALVACAGYIMWIAHDLLNHNYPFAIVGCCWTVLQLYVWWQNGGGKNLKKVAKALGEKSRAKLNELAGKLTPSPVPLPVGSR